MNRIHRLHMLPGTVAFLGGWRRGLAKPCQVGCGRDARVPGWAASHGRLHPLEQPGDPGGGPHRISLRHWAWLLRLPLAPKGCLPARNVALALRDLQLGIRLRARRPRSRGLRAGRPRSRVGAAAPIKNGGMGNAAVFLFSRIGSGPWGFSDPVLRGFGCDLAVTGRSGPGSLPWSRRR